MKTSTVFCVALASLLLLSGNVFAGSGADSKKILELEKSVRALERRVASLEDQLRDQNAPARAPAGKANWRKLHIGMSEGEVEQLLGSPSSVSATGASTIWFYGVTGSVTLSKHGVEAWNEP